MNHMFRNYIAAWDMFVVATRWLCATQDEKPLYHCVTMTWPLAWKYTGKPVCWIDEKAGLVVLSLPLCECLVWGEVRWGPSRTHMSFFLLIVPAFSITSSQLKRSIFVQSVYAFIVFCCVLFSAPLFSVWPSSGASHLARPQQHSPWQTTSRSIKHREDFSCWLASCTQSAAGKTCCAPGQHLPVMAGRK